MDGRTIGTTRFADDEFELFLVALFGEGTVLMYPKAEAEELKYSEPSCFSWIR
jgi:hypothetical protein